MQNQEIHVVSVREYQCGVKEAIAYFQKHWATEASEMVYEDCIGLRRLHFKLFDFGFATAAVVFAHGK